ncbi:hypothetical protein MLD38_035391 [Melastoma candidum]|uniref:Uncharacterized protein n=1 Tax=Melastoma candidum TaxID=119954 RepID=A0ACB9LGH4_9MYRT|nr:hypothetical protein MLD38_035391 [Melastoma candidum]
MQMKMGYRAATPPLASALFGGSCCCRLPVCGIGQPVSWLPSNVLKLGFGVRRKERGSVGRKMKDFVCVNGEPRKFPYIQTLRTFPKDGLMDKVALVRFDSTILLGEGHDQKSILDSNALLTIQYLLVAGAKVILVSGWDSEVNSKLRDLEPVADYLSSVLRVNVVPQRHLTHSLFPNAEVFKETNVILLPNLNQLKDDRSNSETFSQRLSSGVDIFVNDSFSQCHKVLASTVGIASFCDASVAGFQFEESLKKLNKALESRKQPYIAIIGGANLPDKASALHHFTSVCDGLVFVGMMAFQIMHALKLPVPMSFLERGAFEEASKLVQIAQHRKIPILCPKDFWCINHDQPEELRAYPAESLSEGLSPVDLGPRSLEEISFLLNSCKKVVWIGPVRFKFPSPSSYGSTELAKVLVNLCEIGRDVTVVGSATNKAMKSRPNYSASYSVVEDASIFWQFLKGRKLPGVMALDRAYPFKIDWNLVYQKPSQPLAIDIGSGNGLFLLEMAKRQGELNFLGLEINETLVKRCLHHVHQHNMKNGYFIATNATSTFRSIVSTYPGEVVLISIQCPNPDFNGPDHRWRMLRRSLVEAIADLLACNGKVFLQSDVEIVALRMKELFLTYGKGKLELVSRSDANNSQGWLDGNPFGIRSDWERHVLDRGAPMYRLMLGKS